MLIVVMFSTLLVAAAEAPAKQASAKPARAVVPRVTPEVYAKRLAYMELRRKEWALKMQQQLPKLASSHAAAAKLYKKKKKKKKRKQAFATIAGFQNWVNQQIRNTKSTQWVPALDFGHPVVHAAGTITSRKGRTDLTIALEKIIGPQEALCSVSYTEGVFTGRAKVVTFVRHVPPHRFLFRIPTQPLFEGKSVPLNGWFVIVGKESRTVTIGAQTVKQDVWIVEPITKSALFRPPMPVMPEKKPSN